jgi:hypothetical protein
MAEPGYPVAQNPVPAVPTVQAVVLTPEETASADLLYDELKPMATGTRQASLSISDDGGGSLRLPKLKRTGRPAGHVREDASRKPTRPAYGSCWSRPNRSAILAGQP